MLGLGEGNSRNLEVCTLKGREEGTVVKKYQPCQGFERWFLIPSFCNEETKAHAFWITSTIRTVLDFSLLNVCFLWSLKGGKWGR